jgi:hypothetical protein
MLVGMKIALAATGALVMFGVQTMALAQAAAPARETPLPRVFLVSAAALAQEKAHPQAAELKLVKAEADKALRVKPMSVTVKSMTPPSGDKHDYMSMARYWWPNQNTANHLPYIRKDGQSNPEIMALKDHESLTRTAETTRALALGWYLTGDEKYAEHAAELLRTFFLDPATKMNPNMEFAQAIPGVNTGRGAGVLDSRGLAYVVDALGMLKGAKAWTAEDEAGMRSWFSAYYTWLTTSKHGKQEIAAPNNHGSWAAVQVASIAQYLGKTDDVKKKIAETTLKQRIPEQFDADGMQKYELARTNSFSYSAFNLQALTELASIVSSTGVDLYQPVKLGSGASTGMLKGIDALLPYDKQHKWPHDQITGGKEDSLCPALEGAAAHTHAAKYVDAEKRFGCEKSGESALVDPVE